MSNTSLLAEIGDLITACDELASKLKRQSVHLDSLTGVGFVYLVHRGIQLINGTGVHLNNLSYDQLGELRKLLKAAELRLKDSLSVNS